jgi:hypothetical protein
VTRRLEEIARRKAALISRCAAEREELSSALHQLQSHLSPAGILSAAFGGVAAHPILTGGVSTLLASGYAGPVLRAAGEGLRLWRLARPLWLWWKSKR